MHTDNKAVFFVTCVIYLLLFIHRVAQKQLPADIKCRHRLLCQNQSRLQTTLLSRQTDHQLYHAFYLLYQHSCMSNTHSITQNVFIHFVWDGDDLTTTSCVQNAPRHQGVWPFVHLHSNKISGLKATKHLKATKLCKCKISQVAKWCRYAHKQAH